MPAGPLDLTVIVRTCGRPLVFLRRALGSIAAQTRLPAMVIISNDGGDGAGVERELVGIELRGLQCRHVRRDAGAHPKPNRSAALNRAIDEVATQWIAFLDDDDTWAPVLLERVEPLLRQGSERPDFGGVVTRTEAVYERVLASEIREVRREPFNPALEVVDLAMLAVENRFTINALVVKREVFAHVGGFREDLSLLEDWEFNVRAASRFQFEVLPEMLARYHQRLEGGPAENSRPDEMIHAMTRIRNEWLRADIAAGRLGLGQLALAGELRGLGAELSRWRRWRQRLFGWLNRRPR